MAQEEKGQEKKKQQSLPEKGVETGGKMVGQRLGGPVGGWVGGKIAKKAAPILVPLLALLPIIFLFFIFLPVIVVVGIVIIIMGGGSAAAEPVSPPGPESGAALAVSKSAGPAQVDKGGLGSTAKINFLILIENTSEFTIKNITIFDSDCAEITDTIDELSPGGLYDKSFSCEIASDKDYVYENTVTVSGDLEKVTSIGANPPTIDQCISFDTDFTPDEKQIVKDAIAVPAAYPKWMSLLCSGGTVTINRDKTDPGYNAEVFSGKVMSIYNPFFGDGTGIKTTTKAGREFVMTHELTHVISNGSSSTYTQFQNSSAHQEYLDKGLISSYPLCQVPGECPEWYEINEDFAEMAGNFIGDREGTSIDFPVEYPEHNKFADVHLFGEVDSTEQTTLEPVSAQATAYVIVGDAEGAPPAFSPLKSPLWCSGADYWPGQTFGFSQKCPQSNQYAPHRGIDIASGNYNVYSPFAGAAKVYEAGECSVACGFGWYVILQSGDWYVTMAHLEEYSIPAAVKQGATVGPNTLLGIMDNTGKSQGDHVHYVVAKGSSGNHLDPKDFNPLKEHPE